MQWRTIVGPAFTLQIHCLGDMSFGETDSKLSRADSIDFTVREEVHGSMSTWDDKSCDLGEVHR